MRGETNRQEVMMFSVTAEQMVPRSHPIRAIKRMADLALKQLSPVFDRMYAKEGRPSIPPERLLKACLAMAIFSIRSERQLCEQLHYNFLLRWFLDMNHEDQPFSDSVFAKNRGRLMKADVARQFFYGIREQARGDGLLSDDHFTVDGTLLDAWASMKSFQKKDHPGGGSGDDGRNADVDFKGETRSNETHQSSTDPEARLMRKGMGKEARLSFMAHALSENRNGLLLEIDVTPATGTAEREQAREQLKRQSIAGHRPKTLSADKGYDTREFVNGVRALGITPHVAAKAKGSAIDGRTTSKAGYQISQRRRKLVEQIFGWMKTVGAFRKTRYKGVARTGLWAHLVGAAYNMVRVARLKAA
jgi:transposase